MFNVQTLWVKFVSCMTAVGSGLPVGPEGPLVHIGELRRTHLQPESPPLSPELQVADVQVPWWAPL